MADQTLLPTPSEYVAGAGGRALYVGFVATLLNAAIAGVLIDH